MFEHAVAAMLSGEESGGIPIGAALARGSELISVGYNERVQRGDPVAHAEITCLRNAGRVGSYEGMTLYTTLSPCIMCSGAIVLFNIRRVVVGEAATFRGDLGFLGRHGVDVALLNDQRCLEAMKRFKEAKPDVWNEDIGQLEPSNLDQFRNE